MKILIFIPKLYSLGNTLTFGFEELGHEVQCIDYFSFFPEFRNKLLEKTAGMSNKSARFWRPQYYREINKRYIAIIENYKPDIILIYNNQFFFPETLQKIKNKAKICFILGDNPLYSNTFNYNLTILQYADLIISPDSFWTTQLEKIGIKNIFTDVIGYDPRINYKIDAQKDWDLLFIGRNYRAADGYKRAMFYSKFADMNFKLFGSEEWLKWIEHFPMLKKNFILKEKSYSLDEINILTNKARIYPIENNVGIMNGIHVRFFDCIGSGILPLPEWSKDLELHFKNIEVPSIKNYEEAKTVAQYYIDNHNKTNQIINSLQQYLKENLLPQHFALRFINQL